MRFHRPLLVTILLLIIGFALWVWWHVPMRVDMADYVPADSLVYLEFNSVADVARAVEQNETWRAAAPILGARSGNDNHLLTLAARVGLAPVDAVVFSRAQLALAIIGLSTNEEADTLHVKPEAALIIETHTAHWRIKPAAVAAVNKLATFAYGQSTCQEHKEDADMVECSSTRSERKLVAAIDDTVVIIANTEKAVRSCLEVRHGQRPGLRTDAELISTRKSMSADNALGFGYVSAANSAKLFAWAAPLLMGRGSGDQQLEQMLASNAAKILRGVSWTTRSVPGGVEDRYQISLQPEVVSRLEPAFVTTDAPEEFWKLLPANVQALSIYRSRDPASALTTVDSTIASKLDAVSSVVLSSLLKSGLMVYGVDDPKSLFSTLASPFLTVKQMNGATGSVLVARVANREAAKQILAQQNGKVNGQIVEDLTAALDKGKDFAAVFVNDYLIIGKTENVSPYVEALRSNETISSEVKARRLDQFIPQSGAAAVTYTNDEARISSFISVLAKFNNVKLTEEKQAQLQTFLHTTRFSLTESSLTGGGIERRTRSAFGQFSTLLSFFEADSSTP